MEMHRELLGSTNREEIWMHSFRISYGIIIYIIIPHIYSYLPFIHQSFCAHQGNYRHIIIYQCTSTYPTNVNQWFLTLFAVTNVNKKKFRWLFLVNQTKPKKPFSCTYWSLTLVTGHCFTPQLKFIGYKISCIIHGKIIKSFYIYCISGNIESRAAADSVYLKLDSHSVLFRGYEKNVVKANFNVQFIFDTQHHRFFNISKKNN